MKEMIYQTLRDGTIEILDEGTYNGYEYAIISYKVHPCCYVRIPENDPLYKISYLDDDCKYLDKIGVHGGITFTDYLNPKTRIRNKNEWWIGWDFAHFDDRSGFYAGKEWTTKELLNEIHSCINQLKELKEKYNEIC